MKFNKVAIIGVGLLGGSIGLELSRRKISKNIVGCGRSVANLKIAQKRKLITSYTTDASDAMANADLIILAGPISAIIKLLPVVAKQAKAGALVMDVGSTKVDILKAAEKILPKTVNFVGAHPLAGTEKSGAMAALAGLFTGKTCVLTPRHATTKAQIKQAAEFWKILKMNVFIMPAERHDLLLANTSHLPQVVAYLLMNVVAQSVPVDDANLFSGSGLRDTTRLAASSPDMWMDILSSNRANLIKGLKWLTKDAGLLIKGLEKNNRASLIKYFEKSVKFRKSLS